MDSISFFIKSLVIAFVAVLFMQIEVGNDTIEGHILYFARNSNVTQPIQTVASGAAKAVRNGWNTVTKWVNHNKPSVGERASSMFNNFERSEAYKKAEAAKREAAEAVRREKGN